MSALQKLLAAKKAQTTEKVAAAIEPEYITKLASACEYAAQVISGKYIADSEQKVEHTYTQKTPVAEKLASVAKPDFLTDKLREKVAFHQEQEQKAYVEDTRNIVANIISRFAKNDGVEYTSREKNHIEVDTPSALVVAEETSSNPEMGNSSVDVVAATAGTRLSDVLAAAQSANGAGESATIVGTKTAGAQGKGPMAVGAATNRIKARLMSQAGGK
jgi:hypothetical protein